MRRLMVTLLGTLAVSPLAAADAAVRPPGLSTPIGTEQLSDERRITRWAHAIFQGTIRRNTWVSSPKVGRLRRLTEDLEPEVYLVLESHVDSEGKLWFRVRVPGRPNGRKGWALADNFSELTVVRTRLRVNRKTLRAKLYRNGKVIWISRIGVGKAGTPTPAGKYYVRERLRNLRGDPLYGPWAFGTSAYSTISDWPRGGVVGIHGTNQPQLIPGRPSHGCIRVPNRAIRRLARLMPIGTPIEIV
jgi:hypothetical protein